MSHIYTEPVAQHSTYTRVRCVCPRRWEWGMDCPSRADVPLADGYVVTMAPLEQWLTTPDGWICPPCRKHNP